MNLKIVDAIRKSSQCSLKYKITSRPHPHTTSLRSTARFPVYTQNISLVKTYFLLLGLQKKNKLILSRSPGAIKYSVFQ